jgi:hypothetical protein
MQIISSASLEKLQSKNEEFAIIFITLDCKYCNDMIELAESLTDKLIFIIEIDQCLAEKYSISKVPVWMVFHGDLIFERIEGLEQERLKLSKYF